MIKRYKNFKYKNISLLIFSILFAIFLWRLDVFHEILLGLGTFGYVGAFLAGILFVWIFSMPTALLILLTLSQSGELSPLEIGIIAGLGAVVGDLIIFRFVRGGLSTEIKDLYSAFGGTHLSTIFNSRYFHWTLPFIGAIVLATPLPDEVGVSLLGISSMKTYQFILLSFLLNSLGIYAVIAIGQIF